MSNALSPDRMSTPERLDEVADLLAAGLIRLRERKSRAKSGDLGESRLDFAFPQRRHANHRRTEDRR